MYNTFVKTFVFSSKFISFKQISLRMRVYNVRSISVMFTTLSLI